MICYVFCLLFIFYDGYLKVIKVDCIYNIVKNNYVIKILCY